ncbi:nucleoside hydrolase [Botrimarina mediterranea]|uniref:Pyrimidine-specific ribonucleoside hydrolase RihA n=1 Tax=Botrimarina mediterranea TaxID=2528022 RepID=A0A518KAC6_9BACT|nr:nucleoside hydrolase [Botrimarina mediterranea]QDV74736.1 Pyrimidine-specific ribonucleoside hydrolase RihA [Botrimarina mediterranea]QDV79368.1 Pyrimidine-specific ribonucleoside hydrolase RihA [Planctomycetes bacterium K2D]
MPRKVILDLDPGVDDAVAICVALADPNLEVIAVTATGGAVSPDQASRNLQAIVERIDPPRRPRIGVADALQPLRTDARDLHGANGLCGAELPVAEKANRHLSPKVIAEEVRANPGEIVLIGGGPMSNVAAVLTRERDAAETLLDVVVQGGSVAVGGDVTAAAEFNVYCDAGSAREVFRSNLIPTVVPLDVVGSMSFSYDLLDFVRNRDSRTCRLLAELLPGYYRAYRQRFGIEGVRLHALVALLAAAYPGIAKATPMYADVETSGELTHGATVFDRRDVPGGEVNVEVVMSIDAEAARDIVFRALDQAV